MFHSFNQIEIRIIGILASMRTALTLLILLVIVSPLGTMIPQGETAEFYLNNYGSLGSRIILILSFDRVFDSWWYLTLSGVLMLSILVCCIRRIRQGRLVKQWPSLAIHLGLVVIFGGVILSSAYAVKDSITMSIGDCLSLQRYGLGQTAVKVSNFKIEYYDNGQPKQYVTTFQVSDGTTGSLVRGKSSVNHPYVLEGVKLYQASYSVKACGSISNGSEVIVKFQNDNGQVVDLPGNIKVRTWLTNNGFPGTGAVMGWGMIVPGQEVQMGYLNSGESAQSFGYIIKFDKVQYATGLIIKKDPGISLVFTGFIVIALGFSRKYLLRST